MLPGARLVAIHWRPAGPERPLDAEQVHAILLAAAVARAAHARRHRRLPARRAGAPMSDAFELLVIGGGPAGLSAARSYRAAGGAGAVAIVTDEHRMPYSRPPLTKDLLRGESSEDELPIESEAWLQRARRSPAQRPRDQPRRRPTAPSCSSGGRELDYRSCVLATGSRADAAARAGSRPPGVRVIRTLDHVRELTARLARRGCGGRDRLGLHRVRDRRIAAAAWSARDADLRRAGAQRRAPRSRSGEAHPRLARAGRRRRQPRH